MNDLDNLRAFLEHGPFNLTKAATKIGVHPQVLKDFVNKEYYSKKLKATVKCGLGDFEQITFNYFKQYGYREKHHYSNIVE